jgi:hypothetical protein
MNIFALEIKRMPIVSAISIFIFLAIRVLFFAFAPLKDLVGVISDDAFYYIQMASHRAKDGVWTFDGTSPVTGFHFLYGYFLVGIFKLFPQIQLTNIYLIIAPLSCITISVSVYLLTKTIIKVYGKVFALVAIFPFLSFPIIMQSTIMMESWLVILFSSLTIYSIFNIKKTVPRFYFYLFCVGVLGSLSRTDYGMLPGILFCTICFSEKFKITPIVARSFSILLGAFVGVLVVLVQNYFISEQLSQSSASTKFFWSSIAGHRVYVPLMLVLQISFPFSDLLGQKSKLLILFVSFLVVIYFLAKSLKLVHESRRSQPALLLIGCALTLIGYVIFYRYNSQALASWYSSNLVAPISILMASIFYFFLNRRALIFIIFTFIIYLTVGIKNIFSIPSPHQAGMMRAGLYIKSLNGSSTFGSWNAGIISYF